MTGENVAVRDAHGATLKELGEQNERIVGPETDVASSTKSGIFGKAFLKHYLNVSISELDMVSMSAGFAREGLIPYINTFAVFLTTRGADPVQSLIAYGKLNVKLCRTYCGLSDSYDGANHRAITNLTFVRATPSMTVITVVDIVGARRAVFTIAEHRGPVYLKPSRAVTPVFYPEDMKFEIGRGITVREGEDVTIITTGTVFHKALAAAELLETKGVRARVMDVHTIKPIDGELIIECTRETDAIVAVEECFVCGGLGSTMVGVLAEHVPIPVTRIGATDFTEPGDYEQLLVKYGYNPESIAEEYEKVMKREQIQKE